jgi:hypothetical protein|tara:strand:- start:99 stop:2924 length:2826 start_codon:yes stop_codon:yes gene_type:complete
MVVQKASSPAVMFGLKVSNISSSIGWGAQGGTCSLTLVDEGEEPSHTDFDAEPSKQSTSGFPAAGTACIFNFRAFSFGGVLQRETYKESQSGRLYDLVLESPSKLLDGSQVILSDFEAGYNDAGQKVYLKYEVKNVWNAFAAFENYEYGGGDESIAAGGSGGFFGNSGVNEAGMPVRNLFTALKWFGSNGTKRPDGTEVSEDSDNYIRPVFGGKLVFGESEYTVDFSELEEFILERIPFYRVKGPVQSINSIISDLCETAQLDYFIQVTDPDQLDDEEGNPLNGVIKNPELKVRVVDKSVVEAGIVKGYVDEFKKTGVVSSSSIGTELQDASTGKVLIGGPATRTLIRSIRSSPRAFNIIDSFSGATSTAQTVNSPVTSRPGSSNKQFYSIGNNMTLAYTDPFEIIPIRLDVEALLPFAYNATLVAKKTYLATALEIRLLLDADKSPDMAMHSWRTYKAFQIGADMEPNGFTINNYWGPVVNPKALFQFHLGNLVYGGDGYTVMGNRSKGINDFVGGLSDPRAAMEGWQMLPSALKRIATAIYGKMFLVGLPVEPGGLNNNLRWIDPEFKTNSEESWQIADSSWPESGRPITDERFYDSSGRLKSYCAWNGDVYRTEVGIGMDGAGFDVLPNMDFSALGQDWGADIAGFICAMKGGPNKDIYWIGRNPYAIIDTGVQIRHWDGLTSQFGGEDVFSRLFFRHPVDNSLLSITAGIATRMSRGNFQHCSVPPGVAPPEYVVVPQESTRYSWGPWYAWSDAANGKSEVEVDTSMKPETYGSVQAMDQVGFGSVFSGLARIEAIETGVVELAKEPDFNLGDRFAASGPYITNLDISASTGGIKTSYKFSTFTPNFGKLNKYNADRIARINKAALQFANDNQRGGNIPLNKFEFGNGLGHTGFYGFDSFFQNTKDHMMGNGQAGKNANKANGGPNQPINPPVRDQG